MAYDIFLSYARQDTARAAQIKDLLEGLGLNVFFDTEGLDGGDVFPDILDRELKTAGAVVGVWSKHALTRPWVKIECDIGKTRGVLVPLQIEEISDLDRPAAFWNIQFADLSDFDGDPDHVGWLRFIRALARTLDREDLLERESAAQAAEPASDDAEVREELAALRTEMAEMRNAKAALAAQMPIQPVTEVTATGIAVWQEIKDSDNPAAIRRFLETVRGTPLEHVVEGKLQALERADVESAPAPAAERSTPVEAEPAAKSRTGLFIGGFAALLAGALALLYLVGVITLPTDSPDHIVERAVLDVNPVQTQTSVAYHEQACAEGIATGCMEAGTAYNYGEGVSPDQDKALNLYNRGCDLGDMEACWVAGISAEQAKDYDTARTYYDKACNGDAEDGCKLLTDLEKTQANSAAEIQRTMAVIRLQSALKDKQFLSGSADGVAGPGTHQALSAFHLVSGSTQPLTQLNTADITELDRLAAKIERWAAPVATPAPAPAKPSWAIGLTNRRSEELAELCLEGYLEPCYNLGLNYVIADGVVRDYAKAKDLYTIACDGGNMRGCDGLGFLYDQALGVAYDSAESNRLFAKACDGGNMSSCHNLGTQYFMGKSDAPQAIARDEALRLFVKACDGGVEQACQTLKNLPPE